MTRKKALDVADVAELDNEKRVRILGIIDNIRELGVNEDVSLPQVCAHLTLLESTNRVHISNEFPGVIRDIEGLLLETQKELELLGPSRQSSADQRPFLTRVASAYQQEVTRALNGNYDPDLVSDSTLKLCMHTRKLNDEFASLMARKGHSKVFLTVEGKVDQEYARADRPGAGSTSILEWIREIYRDSRGACISLFKKVVDDCIRSLSGCLQRC